jgi:hypothetical protein
MRKALTAMAMLAGALVLLAAAASARSTSREHVTIDQKGGSFVLTPAGGGALKADRGAFAACCWTQRFVYIAGQRVEVDNPKLTLTGANGTLTLRNRIQWVDVPGGLSVFSGTWKASGGTGAYAGVTGHGRIVGVQKSTGGSDRAHFFGYLATG